MATMGTGRTGIGENFARARLLLAKRAGYLPEGTQIQPGQAPEQWRQASRNLARDARAAGAPNPMHFLRQGATTGGGPRATLMRPGGAANPMGSLPYANSQLVAMLAQVGGGIRPQAAQMGMPPMLQQMMAQQVRRPVPRRGGRFTPQRRVSWSGPDD